MDFVTVDVDPGPAHEDGLSLRFKRADHDPPRALTWVAYESELGLAGRWAVTSADGSGVAAVRVEDSSDGAVWLVTAGRQGITLTHEVTGAVERAPYLALSLRTEMG